MQYFFKTSSNALTVNQKVKVKLKSNKKSMDFLNLSYNKDIIALLSNNGELKENGTKLNTETVFYSDIVYKANTWKTWQQRVLLITNKAIYNLLPSDYSKFKRKINLEQITSLTMSQKSNEFIIHVPSEYDYRMRFKEIDGDKKQEFIDLVQFCYKKLCFKPLEIELTTMKILKNICLTKLKARKQRQYKILKDKNLANDRYRSKETSSKVSSSYKVFKDPKGASTLKTSSSASVNHKSLKVDDFEIIRVLGRGSFGKVMLVKRKSTSKLYAMKSLHKTSIIKRNQVFHTKEENNILKTLNHPFLIKLHYSFQSNLKLYFILDYLKGGELFYHLKKIGQFNYNQTLLYTAEIILAVGYLHKNKIIYRDLKLENILLDKYGHICLTDFGLSKKFYLSGKKGKDKGVEERTYTFCGTPEYIAPEVLINNEVGHTKAIDWWSLGCIMYEMLVGLPPFYSENVTLMYEKIKYDQLKIPHFFKTELTEIISELLIRDPIKRLGGCKLDHRALMEKKYFKGLDWEHVLNKRYIPEFIPELKDDETDTSNFDVEFTSEPIIDSVLPEESNLRDDVNKLNFSLFTFNEEHDSVLRTGTK